MANYRLGTTTTVDGLVLTGTSSFTSIIVSNSATFNSHIFVDGYTIDISSGAEEGQALIYDGYNFVPTTPTGGVTSTSNLDSTLTISPTTGDVIASLNLAHANTWAAKQTFSAHIAIDGYTVDISSGALINQVLQYNGSNFVAATVSTGVDSKANASNFQLTTTSATDVLSFTPVAQGNFVVYVFYRVATATTNVTLNVTWTDDTGTSTSVVVPTATSTAVGSYNAAPVYINATVAAIKVTATAGTANNLYVSASIIGIN